MDNKNAAAGKKPRVLVLGGNGFIGRHIVKHLEHGGAPITIGTSSQRNIHKSLNARYIPLHKIRSARQWLELIDDVDVVVNAVGILRQRLFESFEQIHHLAVASLAEACAEKNIALIHISILGIDSPAQSKFVASKRRGELAIRQSKGNWTIVRPSLVDGEGGNGARWFRRVAGWPIHFSPANANGGFAPINADDLGLAVATVALRSMDQSTQVRRIIELSGDQIMTVLEYLHRLKPNGKPAREFLVPPWLSRLVCHLCDLFRVTPFSFGHYELLQYRNFPVHNDLSEILGRAPTSITRADPSPERSYPVSNF